MGNHKALPPATVPRNGPGASGAASWRPSIVRHDTMPGAKRGGSTPAHKKAIGHFGHSRALAHLDGYDARG